VSETRENPLFLVRNYILLCINAFNIEISYYAMSSAGWIDEPLYSEIIKVMPLPCVDLLILNKGRLLLMKRNNAPAKGLWFTPGGRILKGESLETAVRRVLMEETGLAPYSFTQVGAMSHNWPEAQTITVFYKVNVSNDIPELNDEHSDYKWIKEIDDDLHPYLAYMIEKTGIFER